MAVKIWDDALQAFKEGDIPLIYDEGLQAWKESTGLVWNDGLRCWQERWKPVPDPLWLYNEGDECLEVTGGWTGSDERGTGTHQKLESSLCLHCEDNTNGGQAGRFSTGNAIDVSGHSKCYIEYSVTLRTGGNPGNPSGSLSLEASGSQLAVVAFGGPSDPMGERAVASVDISAAKSANVTFRAIATSGWGKIRINAHRIWLEK